MSRKRCKPRIRKQSFLLFELLLSLSLLLLCLFPMIKTHVGIAKEEAKQFKALREEEAVQDALCALKEQLYRHTHSWEELTQPVETDAYTLSKNQLSKKKNGEKGLLLDAILHVEGTNYYRKIYVEKKAPPHTH